MQTNQNTIGSAANANPNHHLWNNHGTWWCHFTVHWEDHTKQRVRLGLGTADAGEARQLRDALLQLFAPRLAAVPAVVQLQPITPLALELAA